MDRNETFYICLWRLISIFLYFIYLLFLKLFVQLNLLWNKPRSSKFVSLFVEFIFLSFFPFVLYCNFGFFENYCYYSFDIGQACIVQKLLNVRALTTPSWRHHDVTSTNILNNFFYWLSLIAFCSYS